MDSESKYYVVVQSKNMEIQEIEIPEDQEYELSNK